MAPLPAGCVRIDEALGEQPPDIFGATVRVVLSAPAKARRAGRKAPRLEAAEQAARAERSAVVLSRRAERAREVQAGKRRLLPEARDEVRAYHVKRRVLCTEFDPAMEDAVESTGVSRWAEAEEAEREGMRALRVATEAAVRAERAKRQREDRAGERSSAACRRARQEAPSILCTPLEVRPARTAEQDAQRKRKPSGGGRLAGDQARPYGRVRTLAELALVYGIVGCMCMRYVLAALAVARWERLIGLSQSVCL